MDEERGYTWESAYEKTWETLQDDEESGGIEFSIANYVHAAKRKRMLERKSSIRLGIMRHLFIILDMSQSMNEKDFPPTRQLCSLKLHETGDSFIHGLRTTQRTVPFYYYLHFPGQLLETFVEEFFDQNPISQLGLIVTKDKRAEKLNDLSGNARDHKQKIKNMISTACSGEPSLQNAFELASGILKFLPSHTSREVLVIVGSLTTCDPSNLYNTIEGLKVNKIRCSIISLSAEVHVYKMVSGETGGIFNVALDQTHLKDLLSAQTVPPPVKNLDSKLLRVGFPEHRLNPGDELSACTCHTELTKSGYFCSQCKAKYCTLPVECKVCGLTLVLAPHLARSYHHLFPLRPFKENICAHKSQKCHSCQKVLEHITYSCENCLNLFCVDCESFIHECLHMCPGCL